VAWIAYPSANLRFSDVGQNPDDERKDNDGRQYRDDGKNASEELATGEAVRG
jgi:hypothetical protein